MEVKDLTRVKELLDHTAEFIAYFELAETKMMAWQEKIEQQHYSLSKTIQAIQNTASCYDLEEFKASLTTIQNLQQEQFSKFEERMLKLMSEINHQVLESKTTTSANLQAIHDHTQLMIQKINTQLAKYDVQHFHRIASESCDHIEQVAQNAVNKSNRILRMFQWRFSLLTIVTTLITAFILGLYLSNELPWDMHQKARNERQVGQMLLQAWPHLNQAQKLEILRYEHSG